ncbi:MAG: hypothetical protein BWY56_02068 [Acidobacteria bacterium ADurb.Bin340]|nr:MAG: hypothetical protein BWY56_02068 [Acidobacteria bacterium ADurb.Bin340]
MEMSKALRQAEQSGTNLIQVRGYHGATFYYDPKVAAEARKRREDMEHVQERMEKIVFGEVKKKTPAWLAGFGRLMKRFGRSDFAVTYLNTFIGVAFYVVALHVMPTLWRINEKLSKGTDIAANRRFLNTCLARHRSQPWWFMNTWVPSLTYFGMRPLRAFLVGMVIFLISSPMLLLTVPWIALQVLRGKARAWVWSYKVRHNMA